MLDKSITSSNILLNVLKNYKQDLPKNTSNKKGHIISPFLTKETPKNSFDPIQFIEQLPTYEKICILQNLLKEIISIKGRFEENKNIMIERIKANCKDYYKSQIGMKAIYDYCKSDNPEKYYNYILVNENEERLGKENYDIINKVIFLLRNNNDLLFNLIINCQKSSFEELADFLVNFFFNNTIDSSFNEEELIMIIYLIIEQKILNEEIEIGEEKNLNNIFCKNSFIHYIFKYLTRKPDVRSFTYSILSNYIIQFEEYNDTISIDTKILSNNFLPRLRNNSINRKFTDVKLMNINNRTNSFSFKGENALLNDISKTFTNSNLLSNNSKRNIEDIFNEKVDEFEEPLNVDTNDIEIDHFFNESDTTLEYLKEKLAEYENKEVNDNITKAMKTFICNNINKLNKTNKEIFSNNEKISKLKKYIAVNKENENINELVQKNYKIIIKCIDDIIDSIKDNIISLPYVIKSINSIFFILLKEKYSKEKIQNTEYNTLIFLSNFLIGNIIIPLISNPYFNGILTKGVLSQMAKENLEIISKILTQIISGKLFSNQKEPEYTIFNKYIIDTLPKIFEIIDKINKQKNFKLSHSVRNLIGTIGNPKRNINYDFFEENQENLQQQNICFSWVDLIIFIDLIKACNDLDKIEVYQKNKEVFDKFVEMKAYFYDEYNGNNIDLQTEFFIFDKINYSPYLIKQIHNLQQENFFLISNNEDEIVFTFKKFFVEILSFINKLTENNLGFAKKNSRELILNNDETMDELMKREIRYNKYLQIFSEEEKVEDLELNNQISYEHQMKNDTDFKSIILPNIIETITNELAHNLDTTTAKRVAFYASYLQIHIDELDDKYKEKNYSLLIMEIIKKLESIIKKINIVIINQFYLKVKDGQKLNMIIKSNFFQTKKMEKCICIQYLFDKLNLPCKLSIVKDESGKISKINYEKVTQSRSGINSIQSFIDNFPNCRKLFKDEEDIIDYEEKIELDSTLNAYLKDLKNLLKSETIMERYSKEEFDTIMFELENYILYKLYGKLFPSEPTKKDQKFYNKCCRLSFLKPESLIKDKNCINEKLWEASIILINELDEKFTPVDKVEKFGKAFGILQNSLTFSSGKNDLGIDDTIAILIYVIIKAKPKNLFSNSKYCQLFLNAELAKRMYGILLSQIEMVKNIIYNMKYTDLIGVTEEEFGKDEE